MDPVNLKINEDPPLLPNVIVCGRVAKAVGEEGFQNSLSGIYRDRDNQPKN